MIVPDEKVRGRTISPTPATPTSSSVLPPGDLGPNGQKLWADITREFTLETSAEVQQLYEACCMCDRAVKLREAVDKDGEVIRIEGGLPRDHPCLKHELAARAFVVRTLANLFPSAPVEKPQRYRSSSGYYGG
jgi:hypothetical protein